MLVILSKVPYLLNIFALNATFLTPKSNPNHPMQQLIKLLSLEQQPLCKKENKTYQNDLDNQETK